MEKANNLKRTYSMDNAIIPYLIKVSISIALFYGLYMLLLRKDTFFKIRRFYFLFAMFFSFLFPLLVIELPVHAEVRSPLPVYTHWLSNIEIESEVQEQAGVTVGLLSVLAVFVLSVSVIMLMRLAVQLRNIIRLRIDNETEEISHSYKMVKVKDKSISPFSFFRWIFIASNKHSVEELAEIIEHEQVHVRQYHSIDVLMAEVMCILLWWNPFMWLLKNEMKINLEYLADQGVLEAGYNTKQYQYILLQVSKRSTEIPLINYFNVSQLKKRITMMNKKRTAMGKASKYLLAVPIGIALLLGNAVQATPDLVNILQENIVYDRSEDQKTETQGDEKPSFPGGAEAMAEFIVTSLKYPVQALGKNIQEIVTATFTVKSTGEIANIRITSSNTNALLNDEVIRVIKAMPKWNPAIKNGQKVDSEVSFPPVCFKVEGEDIPESMKNMPSNAVTVTVHGDRKKEAGVSEPKESVSKDDMIFDKVDQLPSYSGGVAELNKFIGDNLKYPESAQKNGIQGKVTIRFLVKKTGEVTDITILKGFDPACDAEAKRVIEAMPKKWIPGKKNGRNVNAYFTIPIQFRLKK